jgi:TATA-box binding protein (TBP) (component of TFIID and TFIIIB)
MKPYNTLPVITQTFIISTNAQIDNETFFERIHCAELLEPLSKKYRMQVLGLNQSLPDGSVLYCEYKGIKKGTVFKPKKKSTRIAKFMLNCITLIFKHKTKFFNIKVSNKGNIQITGCQTDQQPSDILTQLWSLLMAYNITISCSAPTVQAFKFSVMCNVHFHIGFSVQRAILSEMINKETKFVSIFEPSNGYVGVNIKMDVEEEMIVDAPIVKAQFDGTQWIFSDDPVPYKDYLDTLTRKERKRKEANGVCNSFLVFHSGKAIMSGGVSFKNREKAYKLFFDIINKFRGQIESTSRA